MHSLCQVKLSLYVINRPGLDEPKWLDRLNLFINLYYLLTFA